jgi:hypothetical protein
VLFFVAAAADFLVFRSDTVAISAILMAIEQLRASGEPLTEQEGAQWLAALRAQGLAIDYGALEACVALFRQEISAVDIDMDLVASECLRNVGAGGGWRDALYLPNFLEAQAPWADDHDHDLALAEVPRPGCLPRSESPNSVADFDRLCGRASSGLGLGQGQGHSGGGAFSAVRPPRPSNPLSSAFEGSR